MLGLAGCSLAGPADPRLAACGAATNTVETSFTIPAARDIWDYFPALGKSPELENDASPAFVVVFSGDYSIPLAGGPVVGAASGQPGVYHDVICVVQANGTPNIYTGVSRQGYRHP
jgi:hypothetical protein